LLVRIQPEEPAQQFDLSNPQHFAVVRAALDDVRNSLGSMSLIFKGRPDASCQDWRAPFAKSSTPPHDPLFVDKQIGVYGE